MTISSGHLDSLMGMSFNPEALAAVNYTSGTAANAAVTSLTGRTGTAPYAAAMSLQVTSFNDATNQLVVSAIINLSDPYGYGNGSSSTVPYYFTVIGISGNDLLLATNNAAATQAVSNASVAGAISSGSTSSLNGELYAMAIDGSNLGSGVTLPQNLTFTALPGGAMTVAQALSATLSAPATISDSAADVQGGLDALQGLAAAEKLASISLTDGATPTITLTAGQLSSDAAALGDIGGSYNLAVTGVSVVNAASVAGQAHVANVGISDSGANVDAALDPLQGLLSAGKIAKIALTDSGFVTMSVTPAQLTSDQALLNDINGNFQLAENASAANITMTGMAGHANTAVFTGKASQYTVTAAGDGVSFTVTDNGTGRSSTDHLSNFTALQFSDGTDFVAQTPGNGTVTTGNVTELYAAVFGRLPDAPGLAFYQAALQANPGLSLQTLALDFLNSAEYVNNSAHNYAQSGAGDAQFITDVYNNLLHRAPDTGAVPFYQNVIAGFTNGLTAGTAAYAAAQEQGHAQVLVYISASAEFLGDVQITAANPPSAQHWLYLI